MKKYKIYNTLHIQYIEEKKNKKNNVSYWAMINNKLIRLAKEYFFILEKQNIQKVSKIKYRCLGITKKGLYCNRWVNNSYCFQHKHIKTISTYQKNISKTDNKHELGQFYSTNCDYIFKDMVIPKNVNQIIEPFGGTGELIKWINKKTNINVESYDIAPKSKGIIKRDVFKNIPIYSGKFVITNPPYLSKNKIKNKSIFNIYKTDDLYKCFIIQLINDPCSGGILIVPLNFFCSFRKSDLNLRKSFLEVYEIILINIFEELVFKDTSYTVCSFLFTKKSALEILTKISLNPSKVFYFTILNSKNYYSFSNSTILNLENSKKYSVERLTKFNYLSEYATNIRIQCLDNKKTKINASVVNKELAYIDNTQNTSARAYLSLLIKPKISLIFQKKLVILFNTFLNEKRKEFYSLFLSQFRELNRKRISFKLVYSIFSYLLVLHEKDENN